MIIVKLTGGLGNQMFQYAAGKSLARKLNAELKLDLNAYKNLIPGDTPRNYELDCFKLKVQFADKREIPSFNQRLNIFLGKLPIPLQSLLGRTSTTIVWEKHFCFDPDFFSLSGNQYLIGQWQTEKYFKKIAKTIHKDFAFKNPPRDKNKQLAKKIKNTDSVSIHIRRTDYVASKVANEYHGICDLAYYQKCVQYMSEKVNHPIFYVFSDDPEWCKKNLKLNYQTYYVSHNLKKGFEDMRLMSLCKHNIIANSTFSWWGAWLNKNPNKLVLAPKQWFKKTSINTKDLLPRTWIVM